MQWKHNGTSNKYCNKLPKKESGVKSRVTRLQHNCCTGMIEEENQSA